MKIRVIITGATGMVGEGVLHESLIHPDVEKVLVLSRRSCGITHPKLTEIIHTDFFDLSSIEDELTGYNACFFCLGVSSAGMKKELYFKLTYELTMHFARTISGLNPGMVFCYVSGAGTDGTEKGRVSWARVKGRTENELAALPFRKVYNFRPAILHPAPDMKNYHGPYMMYRILYPVFRAIMPHYVSTLKQLGTAMINAVRSGYDKNVLEVRDINLLSLK